MWGILVTYPLHCYWKRAAAVSLFYSHSMITGLCVLGANSFNFVPRTRLTSGPYVTGKIIGSVLKRVTRHATALARQRRERLILRTGRIGCNDVWAISIKYVRQ